MKSRGAEMEPKKARAFLLEKGKNLGNRYVQMVDYYAVYAKHTTSAKSNKDEKYILYPAISYSLAKKYGSGSNILNKLNECKILIKTDKYNGKNPPKGIKKHTKIKGLLTFGNESLTHDDRLKLKKLFPKSKLDKIAIIEERAEPSSLWVTISMMLGGIFGIYCTIAGAYGDPEE